ncbi:L-lactate MFS transporter [Candidatus Enterococcus clewellii]|uniref:Major facilitator superfamily (MFS) profile domain-containing protein n=1 Tax=Candidatus Enterococcus clewellii TaxID=1834193 RepID=A0A242KE64_9ENTE|nr:OFA family MFS transporter [Enterococcus sp. 9E7_DIV0242]OTP19078.1 hypothetical protein A5888_000892 [Enterococcus sp. 9E7_DIV0242]
MTIEKKRWLVLIACCIINLCLGSIYSWSVFASSMAEYLTTLTGASVTSADLALVYTVANSVGPITMITGGWFNDRFGPRNVIFIGGFLFAGGLVLSGFAGSVGFLLVSYGLVSGLGLGMAYGCTISTVVKYFPDKRGLVGGLATAVYGLSAVVISPLVTLIVEQSSATTAFKLIGGVFLVLILGCSFFVSRPPEGYTPAGWQPPKMGGQANSQDKNWRQMMQTPVFYVMIILLTCGAFSGMMVISQASGIAQSMVGLDMLAASSAVSILALFNSFGRIIAGYLSDRIGRINTLLIACLFSIVGVTCLYFTVEGATILFYVGVSIVGSCFGAFMGIFPGFTADQFGGKNNSVNYGIMFIGFALAGYFGPTVMRSVLQQDGSYQNAFLIAAALNIAGLLLCGVYKVMSKKSQGIEETI